jgi:creatinine amidohydrolase
MRMAEMTYAEIAAVAPRAVAVIPTGCTEQQGPHLTVDFDSWFCEAISVAAADVLDADDTPIVVLPALPFGPTPEHRSFGAGFVDIPVSIYEPFVRAIVQSLLDQEFTRVVIWRGCGQHDLRALAAEFTAVHVPEMPYHDVWCRVADPAVPGGHADSFTTSIALARRPEMVRPDRVPRDTSAEPDWDDRALDFRRYSDSGVVGTAAHASAELGEVLWDECLATVVATLRSVSASRT